jgi:DNA polymerase
MLTNVIPWRPPGNRMPSQAEIDICRPFIERQVALAETRALLLLGNFPARFFFGGSGTIHSMRGEWREIGFAGMTLPAIATLHPQELLAAPANKALAWQDLLAFKSRL